MNFLKTLKLSFAIGGLAFVCNSYAAKNNTHSTSKKMRGNLKAANIQNTTIFGPYKDMGTSLYWWDPTVQEPENPETFGLGINTTGKLPDSPSMHLLDFIKSSSLKSRATIPPPIPVDTVTWAFAVDTMYRDINNLPVYLGPPGCEKEDWASVRISQSYPRGTPPVGPPPQLQVGEEAIARFRKTNKNAFHQAGQKYIISTGGASGIFTCDTATQMKEFIDRYRNLIGSNSADPNFFGIDFDIEGDFKKWSHNNNEEEGKSNIKKLITAIAAVQKMAGYENLRVSFTLATTGPDLAATDPTYLNPLGVFVLTEAKAKEGFRFIVNLMVMDYGTGPGSCQMQTSPPGDSSRCDMYQTAVNAATKLSQVYNLDLNQIELTPMIGVNDPEKIENILYLKEIFTIDDASKLATYVKTNHLAGLHYWSIDRDFGCTVIPTAANYNGTVPPNVCTWITPAGEYETRSNEPGSGYGDFTRTFSNVFHNTRAANAKTF